LSFLFFLAMWFFFYFPVLVHRDLDSPFLWGLECV
jgi:hypothetical protein